MITKNGNAARMCPETSSSEVYRNIIWCLNSRVSPITKAVNKELNNIVLQKYVLDLLGQFAPREFPTRLVHEYEIPIATSIDKTSQ
eukprot:CAMPEP_0168321312 /NCGR_PEP_ID=MMETSP0213-20121227/2199_1 /TAXON_ID=151035 /ORGANISM="Euplotes harpa, Strain FSP1.4" /LENGTH=85 /DNA_ID=CAMNT_0008322945 /DNA_START=240 /DNA_END=500 /DNA_ORIENTATION=+